MATDLTCGEGGSTGAEVIQRINTHDASSIDHETRIDSLETGQDSLDTKVTLVEQDMVTAQADIVELQTATNFNYVSEADNLNIPDTYTQVASLGVTGLVAGVYMIGISATYTFDTTTKSVFSQFTLNGGTPEEFIKENKDVTDKDAFVYQFPYTHAVDGDFSLLLEFHKEDATGVLDVLFANLWIERKV